MKQPGPPQPGDVSAHPADDLVSSAESSTRSQTLVGEVNDALIQSGLPEDLVEVVQGEWAEYFNSFSFEIDPNDPYAQPDLLARTVSHYLLPKAASPTVPQEKAGEEASVPQVIPDSEIPEFEDLPVLVQNLITELDLVLVERQVAALEVEPQDQPGVVGNILNMRKALRERGEEVMLRAYVGLTTNPRFQKLQRVLPLGVAMLYAAQFLTSGDGGPLVQTSAAELFGGAVATGITASLVRREGEVIESEIPSQDDLEAFYEKNEVFVTRVHHEFGTTQRMIFLGFKEQAELLTLQVAQGDTILQELRELASAVDDLRDDRDTDLQAGREARERQKGELTHNLPERNPNFTGRSEVIGELLERVSQPPSGRPLLHVLTGPGGIGKTEIAVEVAHQLVRQVGQGEASLNNILVVECGDSALDLQRSYADLAYTLNLPEKTMADEKTRAKNVRDYLSANPGWLLIFDDAQDHNSIKEYLPKIGGHVVCTSRSQKWPEKSRLPVDALIESEVQEFLDKRLEEKISGEDKHRLSELLAGYPLALEQAVAVLTKTGVTAGEFIAAVEGVDPTGRKAISLMQEDLAAGGRYEQTVSTVVQLALQELGKDSKTALKLLEAMSLLAPTEIPDAVIVKLGEELPDEFGGDFATDQALLQLQQRSLVSPSPLAIHAVLQKAVADGVNPEDQEKYIGALVCAVREGNPFDDENPNTWKVASKFLPHAERVASLADGLGIRAGDSVMLHGQIGRIHLMNSRHASAREHFDRAIELMDKEEIPTDPSDKAVLMLDASSSALQQGKHHLAMVYCSEATQAALNIYKEHDVEMVPYYLQLGDIWTQSGDNQRAREIFTRAVQIVEPDPFQPQSDDKDVLRGTSWACLGGALADSADIIGAMSAFKKAFNALKGLGYSHPLVIDCLSRYAAMQVALAEFQEDSVKREEILRNADEILAFVVQNAEAMYGPNSQTLIRPLLVYTDALLSMDKVQMAKRLTERASRISMQSELTRPVTIAWMLESRGRVSMQEGDVNEARRLFQLAKKRLTDSDCSPEHPSLVRIGKLLEMTKAVVRVER